MDATYLFLQHYWWLIISLLAGILVFLLFVQGGQSMLHLLGKTAEERNMIVNSLGRKWELTFTTLVTFGGAFFASFPLFYSTSFGGAYYVWLLILGVFIIQAVAYEFRRKPHNLLGEGVYDWFLVINGVCGTFLLGVAVATLFTGGSFVVDRINLTHIGGDTVISQWSNPWHGLEALFDYRNLALGFAVLFLSRTLALHYFMNNIADRVLCLRVRKRLLPNAILFVLFFVLFLVSLLFSPGWRADGLSGVVSIEPFAYWHNLLAMPIVTLLLLTGVLAVLWGIYRSVVYADRRSIWYSGVGTIVVVTMLLLVAGYNNTAYYPSLTDMQSSLTIQNSSSSRFTLMVMAWVSVVIPFVVWYIWKVWRAMNRKPVTREEVRSDPHLY